MICSTLFQHLADPVLLLVLVGMAAYGFRHGVFLATIAAMQVLAAGLLGIALLDETTEIVTLAGCPAAWCGGVAFLAVFLAAIVAIRLAVGATVREDAVRFSPAVDTTLGAIVGLLGGMMLCSGILVACSMSPLAGMMRFDPAGIRLDMGPKLLSAFARLAAAPNARPRILDGEASLPYVPPETDEENETTEDQTKDASGAEKDREKEEPPPVPPLVGEPFADDNANGLFDEGEPFLDVDKSGGYTAAMTFTDSNGNGRRDIGLLERYRIGHGRWDRIIVVAPPAAPEARAHPGSALPTEARGASFPAGEQAPHTEARAASREGS